MEEYAPEVDDAYKDFLNDDKSSFIKSYQYTPSVFFIKYNYIVL